jgi:ribonuclease R
MKTNIESHRSILMNIAQRVMLERGLQPDFSTAALAELDRIHGPAQPEDGNFRDLRSLLWCSIDNDDSRDLDQLTVAEALPGGRVKLLVAVADVDALVKKGSAIDAHARTNTTSVYTAAEIFPMLPEKLSTDLTSLNFDQERLSVVVDMLIDADGALQASDVYRARVVNHAKLAYNSVAAWLDGFGSLPEAIASLDGLAENLRLQDQTAQKMKALRHTQGALSLETIESRPVFDGDQLAALEVEEKNRAKELIENFMVTANGVVARYLSGRNFPSLRRVVRVPKDWERIVEIAAERKFGLPANPDSKALEEFLVKEKADDPLRFPDLSLSVIKLLGSGEYVAEPSDGNVPGHFGLAVKDYGHSTAPNRRYPDVLTQRLLKAALLGQAVPYDQDELGQLAEHCTETEDIVKKLERQVEKSAAALLLLSRLGEQFDALVTGASDKGTWVRLVSMPVEGKLVSGFEGLAVGRQVRVQLVDVDVQRGYIDFKRIHSSR